MSIVINGIYKHFKGNPYKVLAVARHSETLDEYVVYQALYGEFGTWARPLDMFLEVIERNDSTMERFAFTGEINTDDTSRGAIDEYGLALNGFYQHYKGNLYRVLNVVKHSETQECLTEYQALYGKNQIWLRPLDMFLDDIVRNGAQIKRFKYLEDHSREVKVSIELPRDIKEFLFDNSLDFCEELRKIVPDISIGYKTFDDKTKDLALVIVAIGVSASVVVLAINRLIGTIINRPRYIQVDELNEEGNMLTSRTEMLQPEIQKHKTDINFEIFANSLKFKVLDESE